MLNDTSTALVVLDVQGHLARIVDESELFLDRLGLLIRGAQILDLPIIWVEHYPAGLGKTVPEIALLLENLQPVEKDTFSAWKAPAFKKMIQNGDRTSFLLAGIEAHICIYQTARDLFENGFKVEIVTDAVSSRHRTDMQTAFEKLQNLGIQPTTVEMALYELLGRGKGERFKEILKLIR